VERLPARPPLGPLVALVAVGGAVGALGRQGLALALPASPGALPVATLLTNLTGCLALGLLIGARPDAPWLRPFLATGVLGGFTTFSAFALETDRLLAVAPATGLAYVALSTGGGLALAAAGLALARR
jgi:CrcB protein